MGISRCGKIRLLMWKNFVLQKRRPIWTCCELTVPSILFIILLLIRRYLIEVDTVGATSYNETYVSPFDFRTAPDSYHSRTYGSSTNPMFNVYRDEPTTYPVFDTIGYYPDDSPQLDSVMKSIQKSIQLISGEQFSLTKMKSVDDVEPLVRNGTKFLVAFGFAQGLPSKDSSDIKIEYSIRMASSVPQPQASSQDTAWKTQLNFPIWGSVQPRAWIDIPYWAPAYGDPMDGSSGNGFLEFQALADTILTAHFKNGSFPTVLPQLQAYPFPSYDYDLFLDILRGFFPFFIVVSFLLPVLLTTWGLVHEKETRLKEAMKMIGLPQWINWLSWFLKEFLFLGISVVIIVIVFSAGGLLRYSNPGILFIFLMFFVVSAIAFCALVSTIFSSATLASIMSLLLFFGLWLPYQFVQADYDSLSRVSKQAICLAAPSCISIGTRILTQFESRGAGVQVSNLNEYPSEDDSFTMADVLGMLLLDAIVYFVIALYLENVLPGEYGVPKPPYFFLLKSYWVGQPPPSKNPYDLADSKSVKEDTAADIEVLDPKIQIGVKVENVSKIWPTPNGPKTAVNDLTLDVPQDEITVLLGQNGAGKSTIMSIMVGLYPSTCGTVTINGRNIATDTEQARESLGLCPQFDILFDLLTVEEHLYFYSRLKGESVKNTKEQIPIFVKDVDLESKRKSVAKSLSGGQKRALSVALAFVGGSKTVILDEPTSGMDPAKRRHTWALIDKHKKDRTVLLTTHFMDEADLLGDRIAIMREGELRCAGSSLFLKNRFGCGYHLTISKKDKNSDSDAITDVVTKHIPEVVLEDDIGTELTFQLPKDKSLKFPPLFGEIEQNSDSLGIESIGASVTTMEDVFLKINVGTMISKQIYEGDTETDGAAESVLLPLTSMAKGDDNADADTGANQVAYTPLTGFALRWSQLNAMLYKRMVYMRRRTRYLISTIIIPVIFVLVAGLTAKFGASDSVVSMEPCRTFDTSTYSSPSAYLTVNTSDSDNDSERLQQLYALGNGTVTFAASSLMDNVDLETLALNTNLTASLLTASQNYKSDNFFRKTAASFSFGGSEETVTNVWVDSQCRVRDGDDVFSARNSSDPLMLPVGTTFRFMRSFVDNLSDLNNYNADNLTLNNITQTIVWSLNSDPYSADPNVTGSPSPAPTRQPTNASDFVDCSNITMNWYVNCFDYQSEEQCQQIVVAGECASTTQCLATCNTYPDRCLSECNPEAPQPPTPPPSLMSKSCTGSYDVRTSWDCANPLVRYTLGVNGVDGQYGNVLCNGVDMLVVGFTANNSTDVYVSDDIKAKAWFNKQAYHAAPEALNFMNNIIASNHLGASRSVQFTASNCPLPKTNARLQDEMKNDGSFGFSLGWWLCISLGFMCASFTLYPVNERNMLSKHIQFVSGVNVKVYWLSHYIFDFVTGFLVSVLFVIIILAFNFKEFQGQGGNILLLFTLFVWAALPLTYALTFLFKKSSIAFVVLFLIYFFISYVMLIVNFIMEVIDDEKYRCDGVSDNLKQGFFINPVFAAVQGILDIATNTNNIEFCKERPSFCDRAVVCAARDCVTTCVPEFRHNDNYLSMDGFMIGRACLFLFLEGIVFMLLLFFIEWYKITSFGSSKPKHRSVAASDNANEDSDVAAERERVVKATGESTDTVTVRGLTKQFGSFAKKPPAVKDLTFGIPAGEVFGLLGVNGAGKTTTFRMLTGELKMSSGGASVNGKSITSEMTEARKSIGYCPQYDGLIPLLTGRETLHMFARLRGIPSANVKEVVDQSIKFLDLSEHSERLAGTYSGGNKRKLSTAIALLGNPSVIFLDEPTTGMDPGARRSLWNALLKVAKSGKTIVLTSHSMEECDALCSRLGIMVKGNFVCLGSTQHLKSKFGQGYQLIVKLKNDADVGVFKEYIVSKADGAVLKAEHQKQLTYSINGDQQMSGLFAIMEEAETQALLDDYSLSQTTLEQVFLQFANDEKEDTVKTDADPTPPAYIRETTIRIEP